MILRLRILLFVLFSGFAGCEKHRAGFSLRNVQINIVELDMGS
jgi:hypothetical protein